MSILDTPESVRSLSLDARLAFHSRRIARCDMGMRLLDAIASNEPRTVIERRLAAIQEQVCRTRHLIALESPEFTAALDSIRDLVSKIRFLRIHISMGSRAAANTLEISQQLDSSLVQLNHCLNDFRHLCDAFGVAFETYVIITPNSTVVREVS
jgi:hypothetical protein